MVDVKEPSVAKSDAAPPAERTFVPAPEANFMHDVQYWWPTVGYRVPAGTPYEHILRPAYWANIRGISPGMTIMVFDEEMSYRAELIVLRAERGWALVQEASKIELKAASSPAAPVDDFEIAWGGPHVRFRVVRKADHSVVQENLQSREDASLWINNTRRAMAGR